MSFFTTELFFTDFIGTSIYGGDPAAERNSTSFQSYDDGVKMGCWCLLAINLMSAGSACMWNSYLISYLDFFKFNFYLWFPQVILENYLLDKFSTQTIYFFSYFSYALSCGTIYFVTNIWAIMVISSVTGIFLTSLITLPYTMISEFHKDKVYRSKSAAGTKRGLGTHYRNTFF